MDAVCSTCGYANAEDARFCNQCGSTLEAPADRPSATTPSDAERRHITVFFSDLSGYTAMSDLLDPEDVRSIMNQIFERSTGIVHRYGGRVDKLLGDAVMAVFGDPVAHEDDAERAVRAVLEIHSFVDDLSPEVEHRIGRPIAMHSGVNSGLVVTGGAEFDNAVGDAINVAARLEDLSSPGEILLGPETAGLVEGVFDTVDHGTHELKGKAGPVPVVRVTGIAATRTDGTAHRGAFVGRHEELGILLGAVERMQDGESSVITIRAEAGAGKTRLLQEFRTRLPDPVQWIEGRAFAYGESIPYAAVIDLLRRATGIHEDDEPATIEARLQAAVADLVEDRDAVYEPLARLFGLGTPAGGGIDRETYQRRLLDSVTQLLEALACRAPTVLTFQDLHWADPSTVRLIRHLIDRLHSPLVVVVNSRPDFRLETPGVREIVLRELSSRQTGELVASLLDGRPPPAGLAEAIHTRTDGNPFFVEEIVNSLLESGAVYTVGDGWEIAGDPTHIDLPSSIRGVIAARIDRLDDRRRRVLREASVVGREFLYTVLRRVTTVSGDPAPSLTALEKADLIREKTHDPDLEYAFKHALTQDVAYDGLLRRERRLLHTRAATAIEEQFAGRLDDVVETLAYHWLHADDADRAVPHLVAAGRKAMDRFALAESRTHYRNAYRLLEDQPPSPLRDRSIVELLLEWAQLAYYQARLRDLHALLVEHQDTVDRVGDAEQQGMWTAWMGMAVMTADGEFRRALEILDRAIEIGERAGSDRVIAYAEAWRTYVLWWLGRTDDAIDAGMRATALAEELPAEPYVWFKARSGTASALALAGDFAAARSIAHEVIEFGEHTGSARAKSMGHLALITVASLTLDEQRAARSAAAIAEAGNDPIYEHAALPHLLALATLGRTEEARRLHDDHHRRFVVDLRVNMMRWMLASTDALLMTLEGQPADGFTALESVVERARERGELFYERMAQMLLAIAYAEVAMAERPGLGEMARNVRFVLTRALHAKRRAHERLEHLLANLDDWRMGGALFLVEYTRARLFAHEGDTDVAVHSLRTAIEAAEPAGDTAGLRLARELLTELSA